MGIFNNIMLLRNAKGQLEKLVFRPNKKIAVLKTIQKGGFLEKNTQYLTEKDIEVDVIFSYNHKASIKLTQNPVESGVMVNDHRIIEARTLSIEVGVNNIVGITDVLLNGDTSTLIQAGSLLLFGNRYDGSSRVAAKFTDLLMCMQNGEPFDIDTPYGTYHNMLITSIDSTQDETTISAFKGTVNFQELIVFETQTNFTKTIKPGVVSPLERGFTTTQPLSATQQSLLPSGWRNNIAGVL